VKIEYINHPIHGIENRVGEGEIYSGREISDTILGSCVSLVFYSESTMIGGLSCIVGRKSKGPYNFASDVIGQFIAYQQENNIKDAEYFLIGGSNICKWVLDGIIIELDRKNMSYKEEDVLGLSMHRQVIFHPEQSKLQIYRKTRS
jgi:chemotaxis receptor (MCP) glutamine deamidase CheD